MKLRFLRKVLAGLLSLPMGGIAQETPPSRPRRPPPRGAAIIVGSSIIGSGTGLRANGVASTTATVMAESIGRVSTRQPALIIDRVWEFDGTTNELLAPGRTIIFRGDGRIRVLHGRPLSIRAATLRGDGVPIRIEGIGDQGPPGPNGRDGNGGLPGACRPVAERRDGDGRPSWCTRNGDDFDSANVQCDRRESCDHGLDGAPGGTGLPGANISISLARPSTGGLSINLSGGPPGEPGRGGLGGRHHRRSQCDPPGGSDSTHDCPSGGPGGPGSPGTNGRCTLRIAGRARPC